MSEYRRIWQETGWTHSGWSIPEFPNGTVLREDSVLPESRNIECYARRKVPGK